MLNSVVQYRIHGMFDVDIKLAVCQFLSNLIYTSTNYIIKMRGSESWGQQEAACVHILRAMRPLQWVIYTDGRSNFLNAVTQMLLQLSLSLL